MMCPVLRRAGRRAWVPLLWAAVLGLCSCATEPFELAADASTVSADAGRSCAGDGDCPPGAPLCDLRTRTCVGCTSSEGCTEPSAARCDSAARACAPCARHADCAHVPGLPACHGGTCVACTPDTEESACGGTSCDLATLTCTGTARGSVGLCRPCRADSECASGPAAGGTARCVPITFKGEARGTVCLLDQSTTGGCPRRYISTRTAVSASGVPGATYCYPTETLTTCEAIADFRATCPEEGSCGDEALDDGLCRDDGAGDRCSYECGGDDDCPSGFKCNSAGVPSYCCTNTPLEGPCAL
jgi:hypothetical protein